MKNHWYWVLLKIKGDGKGGMEDTYMDNNIEICTMEYYSALNKTLLFVTIWMNLDSIRLNEISQTLKEKYHMMQCVYVYILNFKYSQYSNIVNFIVIESRMLVTKREILIKRYTFSETRWIVCKLNVQHSNLRIMGYIVKFC